MQPVYPYLSIVIPVYRNQESLKELVIEINKTVTTIGKAYEIVFVDDRSPDQSWETLLALAAEYPQIVALRLNRNHGQHIALAAGIRESRGDWIITMDGDMQDHPSNIITLLEKANEGYDIVLSRYQPEKQSLYRRLCNHLFIKTMTLISRENIPQNIGSLTLLSRKVADAYNSLNERYRHHLHVLYWLKFNTGYIEYQKRERAVGTSSYTLSRLIRHMLNAVFFHQNYLLYVVTVIGMVITGCSLLYGIYSILMYMFYSPPSGWASLAILISMLGGFIIFSLGIIGLYVGKILEQTKNRQLYVIDKMIGR